MNQKILGNGDANIICVAIIIAGFLAILGY